MKQTEYESRILPQNPTNWLLDIKNYEEALMPISPMNTARFPWQLLKNEQRKRSCSPMRFPSHHFPE